MIVCKGVHKSYQLGTGKVLALRGVDLEIGKAGFYSIMGASGSGKSTLLHLLAALDQPDAGSIAIGGVELSGLSDRKLTEFRRRGVGIVFQQFNLIPTLTARENVELPGMLAGDDAGFLKKRSEELLAALGLAGRMEHRPDLLSGGEQQRVAIARALLYKPPVILADEPTGALDSKNAQALWTLLGNVARTEQTTIVMVTHEPAAAQHSQRVLVLKDGLIVGSFATEGLDVSSVAASYQQLIA
jgi:putative ABC transport system ATP-binding protein